MSQRFSFFLKTTTLGLTAWTLVFTREVPVALAQAPIETDCSTELDQPDTTYLLNTNVPGNCVIAADNIILDGQNLYTVGDIFATTTATVNFTVQNVTVNDDVSVYLGSSVYYAAGNVTVINSVVGNTVHSYSYHYDAGDVTIIDSEVGRTYSGSNYGDSGDVTVTRSTIQGDLSTGTNGNITITDSTVEGLAYSYSYTYGGVGEVIIEDSEIEALRGNGNATVVRSTIGDNPLSKNIVNAQEFTITDSTVNGDVSVGVFNSTNSTINNVGGPTADTCTITDSIIYAESVYCATLTLTDTAPSLTVTPLTLELEKGDTFNPFEDVSADDVVDGDLSDEIVVIGEVGDGPGTYELIYSVTDFGTTLINDFDDSTATSGPSTTSLTRTVIRPEEGGSESTRVGARSSSSGDKNIPTATIATGSQNMDEILVQLKTALSQPINTNDPATLKKLLGLLLQLMAAIAQLSTLK